MLIAILCIDYCYVCFTHRNMGGVDVSDALIGYYTVLRKTRKWYHTFFFHFLDIAVVNSFIIHQQLAALQNKRAKNQREFQEALACELADWMPSAASSAAPASHHSVHHRPKHIAQSKHASRRKCKSCHKKTPVICSACNVALCFLPHRDCFNNWHDKNTL